jgi:UDP-glucuronate 4-epimerase
MIIWELHMIPLKTNNYNHMKILVTGTAGFIGYHLTKKLLHRGDTVVGMDNINDYYDVELKYARLADAGISREAEEWHTPVQSTSNANYTFIRMNLEDREDLNQLFENEKFDAVCNLAAQAGVRYSIENPHAYINSNVVGFMNVLEACRHNNIKHLVYASSSSVYGNSKKMPLSVADTVDHPISLYAATKKSNELMAHTYSHLFNIQTTGLRFFTVYGPWGRPDMAPILFANAITQGKPIKVFNHGNLERDFTYVDDIVEGISCIISSSELSSLNNKQYPKNEGEVVVKLNAQSSQPKAPYSIHNIGNGNPVKLMDFIETIESEIGKKAEKIMMPMQPGDVYKTFADVSALKEKFNYAPNTSLKTGIGEFIKWYKTYYIN